MGVMSFLHPEFLYLMLPPVVVLFFFLLTQQEQIADFFSKEVMEKLRVQTNRMTLKARSALFFAMSVLLIIVLAQPVIEEGKVKVQAKSADVMIALDISDSMLAEDIYPSRLKHAKQKILELLSMAVQERMGVMAFAKETYLVAPLSFDHRAVNFLVKQLQPSHLTEKGTDIKQLLHASGEMMKDKEHKYLLVMSDGGDQEAFDEEIAIAKKLGITVFVLGIGTEKGAPIKRKEGGFIKQRGAIIISHLNTEIAELAIQTGGSYIGSVSGDEDLLAMLSEIGAKTTKQTLAEEEIMQYIQLFYYPLGLAMILLLFATSSMSKRQQVEVPSAFIALWLLLSDTPSEAGLMDFKELDAAKAAYMADDFNTSARLYGKYARRTKSSEALYDQANALYKSGAYERAATLYEQVKFEDKNRRFDTLHNQGNAWAKQGSNEALQNAIKAYEEALSIKEEQPTRENLERVQELLKQQQSDSQNGEESSDSDQQKNDQQKNGDQNQSQDKHSDQQKSQQQKSDQQGSPDDQKGKENKADQKEQQDGRQKGDKEQSKQPEADETPKQQKSGKPEDEQETGAETGKAGAADEEVMSDLEEGKWLKILNDHPASHIYRLGPMNTEKESTDAKPW